ncbi:hypothetical protein ANCDUO_02217 [Ancylostoma duodenale]|uniref:Methyltransferase type 11 domain-containing protein n=1 Tax=Ancylostoma duodenale TaxID=51022 RepID=A0A0C2H7D9_9BILA|nr:hypothetical protein ANCDUO_02217 [Ancylostoma duodenale]
MPTTLFSTSSLLGRQGGSTRVLEAVIAMKDAEIVDVGCGGGLLSVPLARAGLHVTGLDATEEAKVEQRTLSEPALREFPYYWVIMLG